MKRALLIAGGTISGLGAVLAITPPQLGSSQAVGMSNGMGSTSGGTASSTSSAAAITASATPPVSSTSATPAVTAKKKVVKKVARKSSTNTSTQNASTQAAPTPTPTPTPTQSSTPTPTPTKALAPAKNAVSGTFTGPSVFVSYGNVQVEITVRDGKIVDAQALQSPNGRSQRFSDYALPQLRQETLAAQSSSINNISGASYTSYGWYKSLQGALAKAGL